MLVAGGDHGHGLYFESAAVITTLVLLGQIRNVHNGLPQRPECGQVRLQGLGDVLLGDVIEFVQKYLWW